MPGVFGGDSGLDEDQDGASSLATTATGGSISGGDTSSQTNLSDIGIESAASDTFPDVPLLPGDFLETTIPDDSDVILNDSIDAYSNIEIGNVGDGDDSVIIPTVDVDERDLMDRTQDLALSRAGDEDRLRTEDEERLSDIHRDSSSEFLRVEDSSEIQEDTTSREDSSAKSSPTSEVKTRDGDIGRLLWII